MLGFGSAVNRNFDEAWGALSGLKFAMDKALCIEIITGSGIPLGDKIRATFFSDTVFLFTPSDTDDDLIAILISASQLFSNALAKCVPLRGGIAHGKFCMDPRNGLFMGQSLVNAHTIGEGAQWLGIVVDKIIAEKAHKTVLKNYVVEWNVPQKNGDNKPLKVLNWPKAFAHGFKKKPPITISDFYMAFERMFGPYGNLPSSVQLKYENTVKFINKHLPI